MTPGLRAHRSASLRVALATGLPEVMQPLTRELLSVQAGNQRKGDADGLMYTVCAEADRWWVTLLVNVMPFSDGMGQEKLEKWYGKHGFVRIQNEPVVLMARSPQVSVVEAVH